MCNPPPTADPQSADYLACCYNKFQESLLRSLRSRGASHQDAEDALHQAFLNAWSSIQNNSSSWDGSEAYFFAAVRRELVHLKARQLELEVNKEEVARAHAELDFIWFDSELPAMLDRALAELAEIDHNLWLLAETMLANMKPEEARKVLDVAESTYYFRRNKVRGFLMAFIEQMSERKE